jgi:hypothetical protein
MGAAIEQTIEATVINAGQATSAVLPWSRAKASST